MQGRDAPAELLYVPALQVMQYDCPASAMYVPPSHAAHVVELVSLAKYPGRQFLQAVLFAWDVGAVEYLPSGQRVQDVTPSLPEYFPAGQSVQVPLTVSTCQFFRQSMQKFGSPASQHAFSACKKRAKRA